MVLTVSFALPVNWAFLPPSLSQVALRKLDASVEASGPHDFAVRESLPQKPLNGPGTCPAEALAKVDQRRSSCAAAASTASHPNVRDDRDTPLVPGRDGRRFRSDLGWRRREIFLRMGLD